MGFLKKIQGLPLGQRKLILWIIVIVLSLILFILWARNVGEKMESFPREEMKEQFRFPEFPGIEIPEIEFPEIPEE